MISGISPSNSLHSFFVDKSETKKDDTTFSILSDEIGFMLAEDKEDSSGHASIFSKESDRKAQITKDKLNAEDNPFGDSLLPDAIFDKIKELFPSNGTTAFANTERACFALFVTGNAIAQSGGQKEMKIVEENVDWEKVFQTTAEGFQNNMKPTHTEEIGAHYREYLDNPLSPYYFYSDEDKFTMVETFKKQNYEFNSRLFNAAESLMGDMKGTSFI